MYIQITYTKYVLLYIIQTYISKANNVFDRASLGIMLHEFSVFFSVFFHSILYTDTDGVITEENRLYYKFINTQTYIATNSYDDKNYFLLEKFFICVSVNFSLHMHNLRI